MTGPLPETLLLAASSRFCSDSDFILQLARSFEGGHAGVSPPLTAALRPFSCLTASLAAVGSVMPACQLVPALCLPPTWWEPHFPFPPGSSGTWRVPPVPPVTSRPVREPPEPPLPPAASLQVVASSPALEPQFLRRAGHPGPYIAVSTPLRGHGFLVPEVGRQASIRPKWVNST